MKYLAITIVMYVCLSTFSWAEVIVLPKTTELPALNNAFVLKQAPFIKVPFDNIPLETKLLATSFTHIEPSVDLPLKEPSQYQGFLNYVSPEYSINRNKLGLVKVTKDRGSKEAITFVFVMNEHRKESQENKRSLADERKRLHLMWTGSKKVMVNQKVIDDQYPLDLSLANYEDGYAPDEFNVILPSRKPKQVGVSFLWSF